MTTRAGAHGPGRILRDGYWSVLRRGHPLASVDGYVKEHRLIAWEAGLLADPTHTVHHVNLDKTDNRLENLMVLTRAEHARLHATKH